MGCNEQSHHLHSVSACIHDVSQANRHLHCFSMDTSTELALNLGKAYWFWLKICCQPTGHYHHQLKTHLHLGIQYSKLIDMVDKISFSQLADALAFPVSVHRAAPNTKACSP